MKVIRDIESLPDIRNAVLTNGTFDGTHAGHVEILEQLIQSAKEMDGESVVLTYWPHPRIVLGKADSDFKLLFTLEERIELISEFDIDYLIILPFTKSFAKTSSEDFIQTILINKIGVKKLVLGYNHRFGKNREGSFEYLKENADRFGFEIEEIPKQVVDEEGVSSTKIRIALKAGNVRLANKFLQKPFFMSGKVVEGNKIGRTIDFPTANLDPENEHKIIPGTGVYYVRVLVSNKNYHGMMNIGYKPTVGHGNYLSLEVHILDFHQNIYGDTIRVYFLDHLRHEMKFESVNELKQQLEKDRQAVISRIEQG